MRVRLLQARPSYVIVSGLAERKRKGVSMGSLSQQAGVDAVKDLDRQRREIQRYRRGLSRGRLSSSAYGRLPPLSVPNAGWVIGKQIFRRIIGAAGAVLIPDDLADGTIDWSNPRWTAIYEQATLQSSPHWTAVESAGGVIYLPSSSSQAVRRSVAAGLHRPARDAAPIVQVTPDIVARMTRDTDGWIRVADAWARAAENMQRSFDRLQKQYLSISRALTVGRDAFLESVLTGRTVQVPGSLVPVMYSATEYLRGQFAAEWREARAEFQRVSALQRDAALAHAEWQAAEDKRNRLERKLKAALKVEQARLAEERRRLAAREANLRRALARQAAEKERQIVQRRQYLIERMAFRRNLAAASYGDAHRMVLGLRASLRKLGAQKISAARTRAIAEYRARLAEAEARLVQLKRVPGQPTYVRPGVDPDAVPEHPVIPKPEPVPPGRVDVGADPDTGKFWVTQRSYVSNPARIYKPRRDDRKEGGVYRTFLSLVNNTYGRFDEVVEFVTAIVNNLHPAEGVRPDERLWKRVRNDDGTIEWIPKDVRTAIQLFGDSSTELDWFGFARDVVANYVEDRLFSLDAPRAVHESHGRPVGLGFGKAL